MGYHYGYDRKRKELRENLEKAEKRLEAYYKAICSPVGSGAWEGAVHSSDTIESLTENVRQAKEAYENYNGT